MGNNSSKDSHGTTGCPPEYTSSPLDFFQTPPTTPSEAALTAMASSSTNKVQQQQQQKGTPSPDSSNPPSNWTQKLSVPSEWAVISVDGLDASPGRKGSEAMPLPGARSPQLEQSWQERDSGLAAERDSPVAGEEMTLVLLSLMEHYRASLGLTPGQDITTGAVELLRRLVTERDELVEEVRSLKETLTEERADWQQFQCDLQVAVSVADRLRCEAEQALSLLQERHQAELAQALSRQRDTGRELERLRVEQRDAHRRLSELTLQSKKDRAELEALRDAHRAKDTTDPNKDVGGKDCEQGQTEMDKREEKSQKDVEGKPEAESVEQQEDGSKASEGVDVKDVGQDAEEVNGTEKLKGKGVAEAYLRRLAAIEKKREGGGGPRDPRRIVMLSERSWSLSRLPLPATDSPAQNGTLQSTTLPLCKKEEPAKGRRMDRILQRQDSWSSFYTSPAEKLDEDPNSDYIRPQDGFSALLRRHGGSRRNSLLRWCQSRTQGYKNIEITNFSSSWEDGLAFCAVYHTYLPSHVPYSSLNPADKKENLDLAFQTGASVGITAMLTVEEMLKAGGPDWQRVLGYVESIFRHFEM